MGYSTYFNPEKYREIEYITKELPRMEVGDNGKTAPLTREKAHRHRYLFYDYCDHMRIKPQFKLKTISTAQGEVLEITKVAVANPLSSETTISFGVQKTSLSTKVEERLKELVEIGFPGDEEGFKRAALKLLEWEEVGKVIAKDLGYIFHKFNFAYDNALDLRDFYEEANSAP